MDQIYFFSKYSPQKAAFSLLERGKLWEYFYWAHLFKAKKEAGMEKWLPISMQMIIDLICMNHFTPIPSQITGLGFGKRMKSGAQREES